MGCRNSTTGSIIFHTNKPISIATMTGDISNLYPVYLQIKYDISVNHFIMVDIQQRNFYGLKTQRKLRPRVRSEDDDNSQSQKFIGAQKSSNRAFSCQYCWPCQPQSSRKSKGSIGDSGLTPHVPAGPGAGVLCCGQ